MCNIQELYIRRRRTVCNTAGWYKQEVCCRKVLYILSHSACNNKVLYIVEECNNKVLCNHFPEAECSTLGLRKLV
ncbi:MAG: hypothetical protein HY381_02415 [Candidatus Chisholmbacteria bacterium]|nr:hypothetical protein [Candidatus Chisholmbacteria bacterium]